MAKVCNFIQKGDRIDYVNGGDEAISYGDVVEMASMVGIAACDIPAKGTGVVDIAGVYSGPKAAEIIAAGTVVYWDAEAENFTTSATGNTPAGYSIVGAASADDTIIFKLAPIIKATIVDNTTLQYTNVGATKIDDGDVVSLATRIGIALEDIASAETGSLAVQGTFTLPKKTNEAFTLGQKLYWIVADGALTATAGDNIPAGWATAAAAETAATASVKLEA